MRFLQRYFDTVPADTSTGWTMLAPSEQSVGRAAYESFWGSIASVDASNLDPVGPGAVDLTLTYHFHDGRVVVERQRLSLTRSTTGGYLITDDQVLSSRTISE